MALNVVAIGGGHGLSATLRAVRRYADGICGVVTVGDDGGSTGRLRRAGWDVVPGDLRKTLVALAPPGSLLAAGLEHRFASGERVGTTSPAAIAWPTRPTPPASARSAERPNPNRPQPSNLQINGVW